MYMKKTIALLLVALLMLSGCQISIANPFATESATQPTSDSHVHTTPTGGVTEEAAQPTAGTDIPVDGTEQTVPLGGGKCETCGKYYADGCGFESLCFECQEKYGPKCSVCGTDCAYRGTIDGMCDTCWSNVQAGFERCNECGQAGVYISRYGYCDDCYEKNHKGEYGWCAVCGTALSGAEPNSFDGTRCFNCAKCESCGNAMYPYEFDASIGYICSLCRTGKCFWCGAKCGSDGIQVDGYYCCQSCATPSPCDRCGTLYYFWDMFEGTCFNCADPSGGAADPQTCLVCGTTLYEGGNYDGYCYYCHPNFGFNCSRCGNYWPAHKTESGLCPYCEAGDISCAVCGITLSALEAQDGMCWNCYVNQSSDHRAGY